MRNHGPAIDDDGADIRLVIEAVLAQQELELVANLLLVGFK